MNSEQIQYLLDRNGHVDLPIGTHTLTKPIQLGHLTGDVIIRGKGYSTYLQLADNFPNGRAIFEFNKTGNQTSPSLFFRNFRSQSGSTSVEFAFFRSIVPRTSPKAFALYNCQFNSIKAYAIDVKSGSDIDFISIINCRGASGGGFIRWRIGPNDKMGYYIIKNTRHQTGGKIGPAYDYKNLRNTIHEACLDEQGAALNSQLRNRYVGPVSTRDVNPRGYHLYSVWWNEYWTGTGDFPGCWIGEVRVEDDAPTGQYHVEVEDAGWNHENSADYSTLICGPHTSNAPNLVYTKNHQFATSNTEVGFAGKSWSRTNRDFFKTTSDANTISGVYENQQSGSYTGPIVYQAGDPAGGGAPSEKSKSYNRSEVINRFTIHEVTGQYTERDYEDIQWELNQIAIGGIMSETSGHIVHQFVENGNFVVRSGSVEVEYLLVGGGGAGGSGGSGGNPGGSGGGGGGVVTNYGGTKITLPTGVYQIVVGAGGAAPTGDFFNVDATGQDGGATSFNGIIAYGGGHGGGGSLAAGDGACGGGAGADAGSVSGLAIHGSQGYDGGGKDDAYDAAAGGGGAGEGGGANRSGDGGGHGGDGVKSLITGAGVWYGGGGGGGTNDNSYGSGGQGGGGEPESGGNQSWGAIGFGGGGGGRSGGGRYPGAGGSGRVIIRYNATGVL